MGMKTVFEMRFHTWARGSLTAHLPTDLLQEKPTGLISLTRYSFH